MRNLVVQSFLTVDGVMQSPGSNEEDREGGFDRGGWLEPFFDEELMRIVRELHSSAGCLLLGRITYQGMAAYWPYADQDLLASTMNRLPKYVVSRTLDTLGWQNSTLLEEDVPAAVAGLRRRPGAEIQVVGSGRLAQTLAANDLVDVYRLWTFPVLLGHGKRLFAEGTAPANLRLVESAATSAGVVQHTYERDRSQR